jgi:hypothetical protein
LYKDENQIQFSLSDDETALPCDLLDEPIGEEILEGAREIDRLDLGQGSTSFSFLNRSGSIVELGRFSIEKDTIVINDDDDGCCALIDHACHKTKKILILRGVEADAPRADDLVTSAGRCRIVPRDLPGPGPGHRSRTRTTP